MGISKNQSSLGRMQQLLRETSTPQTPSSERPEHVDQDFEDEDHLLNIYENVNLVKAVVEEDGETPNEETQAPGTGSHRRATGEPVESHQRTTNEPPENHHFDEHVTVSGVLKQVYFSQ